MGRFLYAVQLRPSKQAQGWAKRVPSSPGMSLIPFFTSTNASSPSTRRTSPNMTPLQHSPHSRHRRLARSAWDESCLKRCTERDYEVGLKGTQRTDSKQLAVALPHQANLTNGLSRSTTWSPSAGRQPSGGRTPSPALPADRWRSETACEPSPPTPTISGGATKIAAAQSRRA